MAKEAQKEGVDIKALTEKSNKLWEQKLENAKKEYEKKMTETE